MFRHPKIHHQLSDSYFLCLLLMLTGGFIDCYTYLCRGQVFSFAQTANMLLAGMAVAQGHWAEVARDVVSFVAFGCGIMAAEAIRCAFRSAPGLHWRQKIVLINGVLLFVVGCLPGQEFDVLATTATSFISAMQMQSFRKFRGNSFVSTMCTGNFRTATEHLFYAFREHKADRRKKAAQYYALLLFFILGATLSYFVSSWFGSRSIWFGCLLFVVMFVLMMAEPEEMIEEK